MLSKISPTCRIHMAGSQAPRYSSGFKGTMFPKRRKSVQDEYWQRDLIPCGPSGKAHSGRTGALSPPRDFDGCERIASRSFSSLSILGKWVASGINSLPPKALCLLGYNQKPSNFWERRQPRTSSPAAAMISGPNTSPASVRNFLCHLFKNFLLDLWEGHR